MFLATKTLMTHVTIEGPPGAPPLLLLHSLGTDLRVWDPQAAVLARSFRVIRPDMRGHGLSEVTRGPYTMDLLARDLLALLDALEIRSAHLGGVSIGGMIAQAVAHMAPERVRSLVLCDTALAVPPPEFWLDRAATVRRQGVASIAESILSRWVTPGFLGSPEAQGLRAMLLRTPAEGYASAAEALTTADFTGKRHAQRIPALVVVGKEDISTTVAQAEAVCEALDGDLVVLEGAAHIPTLEKADAVTATLVSFLHEPAADLYEAGLVLRKEVLGEAYVDEALGAITELDRDFQAFLTRTAWGSVWARPGLDRRTRSLLTIALLGALGHHEELETHVRATRNTGATPGDVAEVIQHLAIYAGIPAANAAMRIVKKVLKKERA
ncbi:4-carboxymuconolactone decarboxylase [Pendulispora albinea]|uniref:4-carboxymuconolactone decarboxylase n=1 Tax=Pendulispora albinea TaxID=2741071 RepID=A0ABZ2M0Z2_9BACT